MIDKHHKKKVLWCFVRMIGFLAWILAGRLIGPVSWIRLLSQELEPVANN